jgi:uncharacterized membrane protein
MANYLKQLAADLPRWVQAGYVSAENSARILQDAQAQAKQGWFRLPTVLAALGGVLVFVGIISLVASQWNEISRLARVLMLLAVMGSAFAAAHYARLKQAEGLGSAFAFLGVLIFGANLMLIAQIYNLPPNPPGGALLWALAATLTAYLWPSQLCAMLGFVMAAVWSWFAMSSANTPGWGILVPFFGAKNFHWEFLLLWGALAALSVSRDWSKALHIAGLTLAWWVGLTTITLFDEEGMRFGGIIAGLLLLALYGAGQQLKLAAPGTGIVSRYVMAGFVLWLLVVTMPWAFRELIVHRSYALASEQAMHLAGYVTLLLVMLAGGLWSVLTKRLPAIGAVFVLGAAVPLLAQWPGFFLSDLSRYDAGYSGTQAGAIGFVGTIVLSALVLATGIAAIVHGYKNNDRFVLNTGFTLFAIKLIMLYFDTFWSLSGRAGFFIIGGVLVIAMAIGFEKQRRKLLAKMEADHA